jgi:hypothetical protein
VGYFPLTRIVVIHLFSDCKPIWNLFSKKISGLFWAKYAMVRRFYDQTEQTQAPPEDAEYVKWFHTYWRPAMGWQYLVVCLFDFLIAPILTGLYSYYTGSYHVWEPLTIKGGGMYHLAMGAVVGISVWSRGREKMLYMDGPRYERSFERPNDGVVSSRRD